MKKIEKFVEFTIVLVATETGLLLNYLKKVLLRTLSLKTKKLTLKFLKKISIRKARLQRLSMLSGTINNNKISFCSQKSFREKIVTADLA